jgi:hypothetical protein
MITAPVDVADLIRHENHDQQLTWIALANLATTCKDDAPDCGRIALATGCSPRLFDTLTAAFMSSAALTRTVR